MVYVKVSDAERMFTIPRGLISGMSEYFEKAFNGQYEEGKTGFIALPDVELWIFECFVGWLYTKELFSDPLAADTAKEPAIIDRRRPLSPILEHALTATTVVSEDASTSTDNVSSGKETTTEQASHTWKLPDEQDDNNPVTWTWQNLFDLYIFADKYDTRRFRTDVITVIQQKAFQAHPRQYPLPDYIDCADMFNGLPESSPLYKFWIEVLTYDTQPLKIQDSYAYEVLPRCVLSTLLARKAQLVWCQTCPDCICGRLCTSDGHPDIKSIRPSYNASFCEHHEHTSELERKLCEARWIVLTVEYKIRQPLPPHQTTPLAWPAGADAST